MKKLIALILIVMLAASLVGCGTTARQFGGTTTIDLEPGQRIQMAVFDKEDNIWVMERPAKPGEAPQSYKLKEYSNFGILSGTVNINEH